MRVGLGMVGVVQKTSFSASITRRRCLTSEKLYTELWFVCRCTESTTPVSVAVCTEVGAQVFAGFFLYYNNLFVALCGRILLRCPSFSVHKIVSVMTFTFN